MTQATAKKLAKLTKNTEKYLPNVNARIQGKENPFAVSAAKYYPALKKLASE